MLFACIPEILEEVAYQVVLLQEDYLRPPSCLLPLLLTCRDWNKWLSSEFNPHLYARIFSHKFDTKIISSHLVPVRLTPPALTAELHLRCCILKYLRSGKGSGYREEEVPVMRLQMLWTAYLMMLENEGKNARHLRNYANAHSWIRTFLLDPEGGSYLARRLVDNCWPKVNFESRLSMWLLWFLYDEEDLDGDAINLLKTIALGGCKYELCHTPWHEGEVNEAFRHGSLSTTLHYGKSEALTVPPIAPPAILLFLTSMAMSRGHGVLHLTPANSYHNATYHLDSERSEWSLEWTRTQPYLSSSWVNGSLDGAWEGPFIYTDFEVFASLETTLAPSVLRECDVAHHDQLWNLREYHCIQCREQLQFGNVLDAFFPLECSLQEKDWCLNVTDPTHNRVLHYRRWNGDGVQNINADVIILGEGHSNWGRFTLRGRVRRSDGFIVVLKRYGDGPRGDWLYRGYLVGQRNGNFVGRWRETLTPVNEVGYEGCFSLTQRR